MVDILIEFKGRPAQAGVELRNPGKALVGVAPGTSDTAAMAPALIMGFFGALVRSSTLISLNASPEGSTPIFASTASLAHRVQGERVSEGFGDRLDGELGSGVTGFVDVAVSRGHCEPEPPGSTWVSSGM